MRLKGNKAIWKRRLSNGNSTASQIGQSFDLERREDVKASIICFPVYFENME